jgi:hypothetical protein
MFRMFSLLRCGWIDWVPRWGLLFLLGVTAGWIARAAEPGVDPPPVLEEGAATLEDSQQAVEQLERLGQQVRESTSALIELIPSPAAPLELRRRAVLALATLGLENSEQARILFDLLADAEVDLELRRTILMAFGEKDLFAPLLVPALLSVVSEKRDEPLLRRQALFALRRLGGEKSVVSVLGGMLGDPAEDTELRLAILDHLRMFAGDSAAVLEVLGSLARNRQEPASLRAGAIETLRGMGPGARPAASALVRVLSEPGTEKSLRLTAARALGQTGWSEDHSTTLIQVVFDSEAPDELRATVAELMGRLDRIPPTLTTQWLPVLEDRNAPLLARRLAARMLAKADLGLPGGLELTAKLLREPAEDIRIRLSAGEFLRRSGVHAAPARETLETILLSAEAPNELREVASIALAQVAQAWLERPDRLDRATLNSRLASLDHAVAIMEQAGLAIPPHPQNLETVRRMRDVLRAEKASRWSTGIGDWAEAHPARARWSGVVLVLVLGCGMLTAVWWTMTWLAPLRLGRLDHKMRTYEIALPGWLGGRSFGVRHLLLLMFWSHHERVLDAWTAFLRARFFTVLEQHQQQADTGIFVDLPVVVDGQNHDTIPFESILGGLVRPGGCVVIVGSAATGKTTLALRIATLACADRRSFHYGQRLLPVWIEPPVGDSAAGLLDAIRRQLHSAPTGHHVPSTGLLRALLDQGRIGLLLDGISEWSAADREQAMRAVSRLDKPPVLITTRQPGLFVERRPLQVEMPALDEPALARFLSGFLDHSGAALRGGDTDVLDACRYWMELTAGRGMPVDGVRWFAEYLLLESGRHSRLDRAENLLGVAREYVRHRNRQVQVEPLPEELVLRLAGHLAWICALHDGSVVSNLVPESFTRHFLLYLEQQLKLIRQNPRTSEIQFLHQTLADHLAAGHLIDTHGMDEEAWRRLGGSSFAHGPLARLGVAIWDACFSRSDPFAPIPIPPWLHAAIEQHLEAPGENHPRLSARARQLARLVLTPENAERTKAIDALAAMGPGAVPAFPALLDVFHNESEDLELRHAALAVFSLLGHHAAAALAGLRFAIQNRKEHLFLRLKAIDALVRTAPHDPGTVQLLVDRARDSAEIELLRDKASQVVATLNRAVGMSPPPSDSGSQVRAE